MGVDYLYRNYDQVTVISTDYTVIIDWGGDKDA